MSSEQPEAPSREPIDQIRPDIIKAMAIRAAIQLRVFTPLADGPLTAEELGEALGVKHRRLELLLFQLVASGFLELDGERFANAPIASHYLVQGRPGYFGGIHELWTEQFNVLMKTPDSILNDEPMAKIDFAGMTQDELGAFLRGLHGMAMQAGRKLAEYPQFAEAKRVVDVGGGSGGVSIALCEEHPRLDATIVDLPSVVPIAIDMAREAGLADRVTGMTTNIFENPLPDGFDVATARALFQVLSVEQCRKAAKNIAAALPSGGTLFVIGFVTDDSRTSPDLAVGMNTFFLNAFDEGQAYTESQYRSWLNDAGFIDVVRSPFLAGNSLIVAQKA